MQSIPVGATGSFSLVVMPEHLAGRFKDVTLPPVLATPVMIMIMENAALNAIKPISMPAKARSARASTCAIWRRRRRVAVLPARQSDQG